MIWLDTYRRAVEEEKRNDATEYDVFDALKDLNLIRRNISDEEFDAILAEVKATKEPRHRRRAIQAVAEVIRTFQTER